LLAHGLLAASTATSSSAGLVGGARPG
jgi:hypothetical protein